MNQLYEKIGALLKLERERRQITLEDLAEQLKISEEYLDAIENGDDKSLPSALYFNLFAKSYAEELGIDFIATIEAIKEELGIELDTTGERDDSRETSQKPQTPSYAPAGKTKKRTEKPASSFMKKIIWFFVILIFIFAVFLIINNYILPTPDAVPTDASPSPETEASLANTERDSLDDIFGLYNWDTPEYKKAADLHLQLTARSESWATIYSDGDTVLFRNLIPGRSYDIYAKYRLMVSVAQPSAVDIFINGRPVDLVNPETGRISRVDINQINLEQIFNPPPRDISTAGQNMASQPASASQPQMENVEQPASGKQDTGDANWHAPLRYNASGDTSAIPSVIEPSTDTTGMDVSGHDDKT